MSQVTYSAGDRTNRSRAARKVAQERSREVRQAERDVFYTRPDVAEARVLQAEVALQGTAWANGYRFGADTLEVARQRFVTRVEAGEPRVSLRVSLLQAAERNINRAGTEERWFGVSRNAPDVAEGFVRQEELRASVKARAATLARARFAVGRVRDAQEAAGEWLARDREAQGGRMDRPRRVVRPEGVTRFEPLPLLARRPSHGQPTCRCFTGDLCDGCAAPCTPEPRVSSAEARAQGYRFRAIVLAR